MIYIKAKAHASCGRRISLFTLRNYFQMPRYMPVNSKDEQSTGSVYRGGGHEREISNAGR
jgi:hypothetical protein